MCWQKFRTKVGSNTRLRRSYFFPLDLILLLLLHHHHHLLLLLFLFPLPLRLQKFYRFTLSAVQKSTNTKDVNTEL